MPGVPAISMIPILAATVLQFFPHVVVVLSGFDGCDLFVDLQFLLLVDDIALGQERVHAEAYAHSALLFHRLAFGLFYRGVKELTVEVVADRLHVAVLRPSEYAARSPDLKVSHRYFKPRSIRSLRYIRKAYAVRPVLPTLPRS